MDSSADRSSSTPQLASLHDQLFTSRLAAARRITPSQQRRIAVAVTGACLALLLAIVIVNVAYARHYTGRVFPGVAVGTVKLGGLTRDAALATLDEQVAAYSARPVDVTVQTGGQRWQVAPGDLRVEVDTVAAVDEALQVGRERGPFGNLGARLGALLGGHEVRAPAALDEAALDGALRGWAPGPTYPPTNALFVADQQGKLTIQPDKAGIGFAVEASRDAFVAHAGRLSKAPVTLAQVPVSAPIDARMLRQIEPEAAATVALPLVLHGPGQDWALSTDQLRAALDYRLDGDRLVVALDADRLDSFLPEVARTVAQPGVNAQIVVDPQGRYAIKAGKEGVALDRPATLAAINQALTAGQHEAVAVIVTPPPAIVAADLEPIRARAEKIAATPLTITFAEYRRVFVRGDIQPLLVFTEQPTQPEKVAVTLNQAALRQITQVLASDLNQGVRDAQFRWVGGAVKDVVVSQDGREVQFAGTDDALRKAILGATGTATPVVAVTPPKVTSAQKAQMVITDRLAYGRTDYSFSIPSRKHNVELAMERLDGALIPPGATFSFNQTVGEQTVANGYQEAYGIALVPGPGGGAGRIQTVSSIGGGICQVSTTLFQGVFRAGLPIQERNWHLYWIPGYGAPPSGLQGLDSTVDSESGLDLRFENTTGGWLAIEAVADGANVRIALYGKDPGWQVSIDATYTNERKADPKPVLEKTTNLPPGQELQVEHAVDGFDAAIHRRVLDKDGKLLRDTTFTSSYQPSRNVTQIGVAPGEATGD